MSPKFFSWFVIILFLLLNSNTPENAVTVSNFVYFLLAHNLLNINFCFFTSSLNMSFTLLAIVTVSIIAIFSILIAFLFFLFSFFSIRNL